MTVSYEAIARALLVRRLPATEVNIRAIAIELGARPSEPPPINTARGGSMVTKKKSVRAPKVPAPTPTYAAGDRVRVLYRGLEYTGVVQTAEVLRGAIRYSIVWPAESVACDPALRGLRFVTDADIVGLWSH